MWYKFTIDYGKGHMSHDETYRHYTDNTTEEIIKDDAKCWARDGWWYSCQYTVRWEKEIPPKEWFETAISKARGTIRWTQKRIKMLEAEMEEIHGGDAGEKTKETSTKG